MHREKPRRRHLHRQLHQDSRVIVLLSESGLQFGTFVLVHQKSTCLWDTTDAGHFVCSSFAAFEAVNLPRETRTRRAAAIRSAFGTFVMAVTTFT
jgi:hypothetical protein